MRSTRALGGVVVAAVLLAGVATIAARAGRGEVTVAHLATPDATVPPGGPSDDAARTPLVLTGPGPDGAAVSALRVQPAAGGEAVTLGALRGPRGTVVAFWASYCIPCKEELPLLQRRAPALAAAGVSVVLVNLQEDAATAGGFLHSLDITLPGYGDADGAAHDGLRLVGVPSTAILGPDAGVVTRLEGPDTLQLDSALRAMGISA